MEIPSEFDMSQLLSFLGERQGRFNIRASQSWGSLYVLDLGETYKFLKSLSEFNGNSKSTFLEFIDRRIVESKDKSKNWLSCVKDCDPMNQAYVSFHIRCTSDTTDLSRTCSLSGTTCPVVPSTLLCHLTLTAKNVRWTSPTPRTDETFFSQPNSRASFAA